MSSPKSALVKGALWTVSMRWAIKVLGFVNTIIMARILMPEDYGIIAMAMLVVGLTEALLDVGAASVLLAKPTVDRDDIDSTWTLRALQGLVACALLVALAYPASLYFQEPRVLPTLMVLAICIAISGTSNVGMVLAQKELDFFLAFKVGVISKLLGVIVTLTSGWLLQDYRALLLGVATGYLSAFALSYILHPYRANPNTRRINEIWKTSKWMMISNVAGFILRKGDELAAARVGSTADFGQYNVGADLGQLPTGEVGPAMLRALLPVLSSIQTEVERTRAAVLKTISAVNTITLPIGLIFFALAPQATELVLGARWTDAAQFVAIFAIISTTQIIFNPISTLLFLRGQAHIQTLIVWIEFLTFVATAVFLVPLEGIMGLASARLISTATNAILLLAFGRIKADFPIVPCLRVILRPLLGALLAAALAWSVAASLASHSTLVAGMAAATVAGLVYVIWIMGTWLLVGRPEGAESTAFDHLVHFIKRG